MTKEELDALREKTKAVQKLMNLDKLDITDVDLKEVAKLEQQASKPVIEQMQDLAKDNSDYKTDKLQQHFSSIRSIKAVNGMIFISVDSHSSRKAATERAIRVLGLHVTPEKLKEYIDAHTYSDTLMSVSNFVGKLRIVALAVAQCPELFGKDRGGGEVAELFKEAKQAIREARAFWRKFKNGDMLKHKETRDFLTSPDFSTSDKASIKNYLGEDYKLLVRDEGNVVSGMNLLDVTSK